VHRNRAFVTIDDPLHETEPDAGAVVAGRSGGVGLEEALEDVRREARDWRESAPV
jgi:hypothetical protein